jgi:hypothetical protein
MKYKQVQVISGKGDGPDRFAQTLRSITVDGRNRLYAAGDSELKVFDSGGRLRRRWPTSKPGYAVAVAADGSVYIGQTGQVEIFDGDGRLADKWIDAERLGRVTAIGFLGSSVLIGDANDRAIRRYETGGKPTISARTTGCRDSNPEWRPGFQCGCRRYHPRRQSR